MGSRNQIQSQFQGKNLFVRDTKYTFWGIKIISPPQYPLMQNFQFSF